MNLADYQQIEFRLNLREEFARRVRANFRYSIRAFARDLEIDSSSLSKILSGDRTATPQFMRAVAEKLALPINAPAETPKDEDFTNLEADTFHIIADWYHFAIWDLTETKTFRCDVKWIAQSLSISECEVKNAVDRLIRIGMLKIENGTLVKTGAFVTNDLGMQTTAAKKEYQRQVVRKALEAVDGCTQERKDISSITISTSLKKLEIAREMIKNFRRQLCAEMESGPREDVYHLTIQLYPVTGAS